MQPSGSIRKLKRGVCVRKRNKTAQNAARLKAPVSGILVPHFAVTHITATDTTIRRNSRIAVSFLMFSLSE
jgi:hypothetical protein